MKELVGLIVALPNAYDANDELEEIGWRGTIIAVAGPMLLVRVEYELGEELDEFPEPKYMRLVAMTNPSIRLFATMPEWCEYQDYWDKEKWRKKDE